MKKIIGELDTMQGITKTLTGHELTEQDLRKDEIRIKNQIVLWLQRRFSREGLNAGEYAAGKAEIITALRNPEFKPDTRALQLAMEQEECGNMTGYFDCPCDSSPIEKCPHSHAFYKAEAIYDKTGAIIGVKTGADICPKFQAEVQRRAEEKKREEEIKKKGYWGKDPVDYARQRDALTRKREV